MAPRDLVAPFQCEHADAPVWLAPLADVVAAATGAKPLTPPCCDRRFGVHELGRISFFSREEWDATADDESPRPWRIASAYAVPLVESDAA